MSRFRDAEDPRRRILIRALASGALASWGLSGEAVAASIFGGIPKKLPQGQSVFSIEGNCTVNGQEATIDSRVLPGDTVETGSGSQMIFVVGDTALLLRDKSKLVLDKPEDNAPPASVSALRLVSGKLLSVYAPGRSVKIDTPSALISIRGTGLYLETDPEQTYFCTCFGVTEVVAKDDPNSKETVIASHHDRPLYVLQGKQSSGKNIRSAPFKNHTDQELALVETLVGRVLPASFPALPDARYRAPTMPGYNP